MASINDYIQYNPSYVSNQTISSYSPRFIGEFIFNTTTNTLLYWSSAGWKEVTNGAIDNILVASSYANRPPVSTPNVLLRCISEGKLYFSDNGDWTAFGGTVIETDPVWQAEKVNYYSKSEANSLLATKQPVFTSGSISTTTSGITITGTDNLVSNSSTIDIQDSNSTQKGLLSSADWNTFNNKVSSITNNITNPINTISSTVNGVTSTTNSVNTVVNSINSQNQIVTTVNGISSVPANIIVVNNNILYQQNIPHGTFVPFDNIFSVGVSPATGTKFFYLRSLSGTRQVQFGTGTTYDNGSVSGVGVTGETGVASITTTGQIITTQASGYNTRNTCWVRDITTGQVYIIYAWHFSGTQSTISVDKLGNRVTLPTAVTNVTGSWGTIYSGSPTTATLINALDINITPLFSSFTQNLQGSSLVTYDSTNGVFKCNPTTLDFYAFRMGLRLNATVVGGTGTSSFYRVSLRRPDGVTVINSVLYNKAQGSTNTLVAEVIADIPTRVFSGGSDNFQTGGFKVYMSKISGQDLSITANQTQTLIFER